MKMTHFGDIILFSVVILLSIIRSSNQTVYSCDPSLSCGCSTNSATVSRIVGGETAASGTWGWAVSISIANNYLCGGSIISKDWVVTAAHCVSGYTASQITIYAGSTSRWSGTQIRTGSYLTVHPSYDATTYVNDIALVRLSSSLNMSDPYVSAICLPSVSAAILADGEWPAVGTTVVAVGWGRLSEGGSLPTSLQQVTVQTVDYQASTCTSSMADWHVQFCAGVSGGGKDTCQGDSGGPLMMFTSSNQWLLVGLTSSGIGCARATESGVYTRVAAFQSWINSYTNDSTSTLTPASTSSTPAGSSSSSSVTRTTTSFVIDSSANTIGTLTLNIFIFTLINFLVAFFY